MERISVDPPVPSFARWRKIRERTPGATIMRAMQYEALEGVAFTGRLLDFGGGARASYGRYLEGADEILSVNIDDEFQPTHVVPPGGVLPFDDDHFDHVVCLNVLEHVYDSRFVLDELFRVLKPGGILVIAVPFMYRIHGHPDDYSRHTDSWWFETLERTGFTRAEITPQVWGRATSARLIGGHGNFLVKRLNTWRSMLHDILFARLVMPGQDTYRGRRARRILNVPCGWFMQATK